MRGLFVILIAWLMGALTIALMFRSTVGQAFSTLGWATKQGSDYEVYDCLVVWNHKEGTNYYDRHDIFCLKARDEKKS